MDDSKSVKSNIFSNEGRLLQAEYAAKKVNKAGTVMGIRCDNGIVLIGVKKVASDDVMKTFKISNNLHCTVAGLFGDANRIIRFARVRAVHLKSTYGEDFSPFSICQLVAHEMQHYTHKESTRPFGVSLLYAGYDSEGRYNLYSTDPSGSLNEWRAYSAGEDSENINTNLSSDISENTFSLDEGAIHLLKAFSKSREISEEIVDKLEILYFTKENATMIGKEKIKNMLIKNKLIL